MSTVVVQCPTITSASCVKDLMDALFSKKGMVLVAHSPRSLIQDQVHEDLPAGTSSFLHSFNVISYIYYSHDAEQVPVSNEENNHMFEDPVAKCTGFDNYGFLDDFILSLTLSSLIIEFDTGKCAGIQLETSLGLPNENQHRLCSTTEFVIKQKNPRNTARTNFHCGFYKVLESIRSDVFKTSSRSLDCEIKDAKEHKCISVADILRNVVLPSLKESVMFIHGNM